MPSCRLAFCFALALLLPAAGSRAGTSVTQVMPPREILGLRSFDGGANVLVLTFPAVKAELPSGLEDRTIAHFAMDDVAIEVTGATLEVPVVNQDDGDPAGTIEVYAFGGDGVVSEDEWVGGGLIHTFEGIAGGTSTLAVDVTGVFQQAENFEVPFLSFRLRALADRYILSDSGVEDASLVLVPEPAQTALLAAGAVVLGARRRAQRARYLTRSPLRCASNDSAA